MKRLLLLRHAKSSWEDTRLDDHERPLNKRGKRDAPVMGRVLRDAGCIPQRIVSSTAVRARRTATAVAEACGYTGEIELTRRLYLADPGTYLDILTETADEVSSVLLVGHNPGIEELLERLSDEPQSMPTAALASLALEVSSWQAVGPAIRGRLEQLWRPRELPPGT